MTQRGATSAQEADALAMTPDRTNAATGSVAVSVLRSAIADRDIRAEYRTGNHGDEQLVQAGDQSDLVAETTGELGWHRGADASGP